MNNYLDSGSEKRKDVRRSKDITIQPAIINQQTLKITNYTLPIDLAQIVKKERPQSFLCTKQAK